MDKQFFNTEEKFGCISRWLHWSLAILVVVQVLTIGIKWVLDLDPSNKAIGGFLIRELHKPLGVLILILGVISLIWYFSNIHPKLPENIPIWQKVVARLTHLFLYFGILIMPLSGIIMSAAAGYPVDFFHLGTITLGFHKNPDMAKQFFHVHEITGMVLGALILLHIMAALKHHFVNKNNVLTRMLK
jgi:cytochrome b561